MRPSSPALARGRALATAKPSPKLEDAPMAREDLGRVARAGRFVGRGIVAEKTAHGGSGQRGIASGVTFEW